MRGKRELASAEAKSTAVNAAFVGDDAEVLGVQQEDGAGLNVDAV